MSEIDEDESGKSVLSRRKSTMPQAQPSSFLFRARSQGPGGLGLEYRLIPKHVWELFFPRRKALTSQNSDAGLLFCPPV
jgi:hypothetical protein